MLAAKIFDEMHAADGSVRLNYGEYSRWLAEQNSEILGNKRAEADLVFRIPYRDVADRWVLLVLLLEHQSSADPVMPLRMLLTASLFWEREWKAWTERHEESYWGRPMSNAAAIISPGSNILVVGSHGTEDYLLFASADGYFSEGMQSLQDDVIRACDAGSRRRHEWVIVEMYAEPAAGGGMGQWVAAPGQAR